MPIDEPRIILASRSPRRRELLAQIGITFRTVDTAVDETPASGESPAHYVERLARDKAQAGYTAAAGTLPTLGADTTVVADDAILGKPVSETDAMRMLGFLSGRAHDVLSGIALMTKAGLKSQVVRSEVRFRAITADETLAYWQTGEPAGKAGSYAIQGLGAVFVAHLAGSYSNVVGLPLFETAELLATAGIHPLPQVVALEDERDAGQ